MLPTLLAIFSPPSCSIPLCIQMRVSSASRAARVWAASFSWWGKIRALPPPWISSPRRERLRHRRALDVPARPAPPPRRVPCRVLAALLRLPEREVERILLAVGALDALALVHVVDPAMAEGAVVRVRPNAEVDVPVDRVGVAPVEQSL